MRAEVITLNSERNVTLTAYIQEVGNEFAFTYRPAMIVMPGGGYAICSDREADPVALAYAKAGFQTFVLRYTLKDKGPWPMPLEDYDAAVELICENAEKWHVDTTKIAAVGFSAGGHLCACAATMAKHRPAAAILVYPGILREIADTCQPNMDCPNEHVDEKTSPCFIVAACDDRSVDVKNSVMMQLALAEHGVPFECHIYSFGGHGFSTAEPWVITNEVCERVPNWVGDSIGWMKEIMGEFTRNGFTEPSIAVCRNADSTPVLSIMCSLAHVRNQDESVQILLKPLYEAIEKVADERCIPRQVMFEHIGKSTLKEMFEMLSFPKDVVKEIDKKLHNIVNRLS